MNSTTTNLILAAILSLGSISQALTLDEYLNLVKQKNRLFSSYDLSIEASNDKREAGDTVLSPVLSAGYSLTTDKSRPSTLGPERSVEEYSLGVAKQFSTGTNVKLVGITDRFNNQTTAPLDQYSTGGLGISLTQSLWKNFFGNPSCPDQ